MPANSTHVLQEDSSAILAPTGCLLRGKLKVSLSTAPHAIKVFIPVDGPLQFSNGGAQGEIPAGSVALLGSDSAHWTDSESVRIVLFLEPELHHLAIPKGDSPVVLSGHQGKRMRDFALEVLSSRLEDSSALESVLSSSARMISERGGLTAPRLHPRVEEALEWFRRPQLRLDHVTVAQRVGISPSRLSHVFREQIGVSCKRYVLWVRTVNAIEQMGLGTTATAAAEWAGFFDLAHFSRAVRRLLGSLPSRLPTELRTLGRGVYRHAEPGHDPSAASIGMTAAEPSAAAPSHG